MNELLSQLREAPDIASPAIAREEGCTPPRSTPPELKVAGQSQKRSELQSRWICSSCDEPNKAERTKCNNCGAEKKEVKQAFAEASEGPQDVEPFLPNQLGDDDAVA